MRARYSMRSRVRTCRLDAAVVANDAARGSDSGRTVAHPRCRSPPLLSLGSVCYWPVASRRWPTSRATSRSSRAISSPTAARSGPPVPGTVARGHLQTDVALFTGRRSGQERRAAGRGHAGGRPAAARQPAEAAKAQQGPVRRVRRYVSLSR